MTSNGPRPFPTTLQETADAIGVVEMAIGSSYPVPVTVTHDALTRWYRRGDWVVSSALMDVQDRYYGRFLSMAGLARAIAEDTYTTVDFDRWPFGAIDWDLASQDTLESIRRGLVVEVGDHEWFNRAPSLPRRDGSLLR